MLVNKINEFVDKKSLAIYRYTKDLASVLSCHKIKVSILNKSSIFVNKADIYHYQYSNSTALVLLRLLFTPKTKNIITIHDVLPRNKFIRYIFSSFIYRIINLKTKSIIVHSKFAKKILLLNYKFINLNKISVIPVLCKIYNPSRIYINKLKKDFFIRKGLIIFLYIGFIKESKGIIRAIKAFNQIKKKNVRFFIIGKILDNKSRDIIKKNKSKKVIYLGVLNDKEVKKWLYISDALIDFRINSVGETSASVIQMIEIGKPILSTDIGSNKEILGDAGLYCKTNIKSIKELILKFLKDPQLRKTTQKKASSIRYKYKQDNILKYYLSLFNKFT